MADFTFGSDPEFFLERGGELVSAVGLLPPKEKPASRGGHHFFFDNVLAEAAVRPADTRAGAVKNAGEALHLLACLVAPARFCVQAAAEFPSRELGSPEAKVAGCNPEWDVYTLSPVHPPSEDVMLVGGEYLFRTTFRTAGGHVHLGGPWADEGPAGAFRVVRMLDLFLGVPSLLLDTDPTSASRRRLYGGAGSHRTPEHGVEYRTPGNFWMSSPEHVGLVYDLCEFAARAAAPGGLHDLFWETDEDALDSDDPQLAYRCVGYDVNALVKCVNNCDRRTAETFMVFVRNYLPAPLADGVEGLVGVPLPDPYKAWGLA